MLFRSVTVSAAYLLAPKWALGGSWSLTRTSAPQASGMLVAATDIRSSAFGLGLTRSDWLSTGDRWSFTVSRPLAAQSGRLTYNVISAVDDTGRPQFENRTVALRPLTQEWTTEARYALALPRLGGTVTAAVAVRAHPDHDENASSQWVMGLRYQQAF